MNTSLNIIIAILYITILVIFAASDSEILNWIALLMIIGVFIGAHYGTKQETLE